MVKGNQRESGKKLYVGLTSVAIVAINPSRKELNKLLGREDKDDDQEIDYVDEYNDVARVRMSIWLRDQVNDNLYVHSFNILNKERMNKTEDKYQFINSTCTTSWVDEEENLPEWFTHFTDFKTKEVLGSKTYRKALQGEDELANLIRAWLGKLNWNHVDTEVEINTKDLFAGKFKELQAQIDGDYDTPFTILMGVRTVEPKEGEEGETKQYQAIYGKSFLPGSFIKYINNDMKFPNERTSKIWNKFSEEVTGEYGANFYTELEPLAEYDRSRDLAASAEKKQEVDADDSQY